MSTLITLKCCRSSFLNFMTVASCALSHCLPVRYVEIFLLFLWSVCKYRRSSAFVLDTPNDALYQYFRAQMMMHCLRNKRFDLIKLFTTTVVRFPRTLVGLCGSCKPSGLFCSSDRPNRGTVASALSIFIDAIVSRPGGLLIVENAFATYR